ncbi:hypothetical protein BHE74_00037592, partial [Ensete ventricosum]
SGWQRGKMTSRGNLGTDLKGCLLITVGYVRYSLCESVKFGYPLMARIFHPCIVPAISKLGPFFPHRWVFVLPTFTFITGELFLNRSDNYCGETEALVLR